MAKLAGTQRPAGTAVATPPVVPFAPMAVTPTKGEGRSKKEKVATGPRKGDWFALFFSGKEEDVIQRRRYGERGGFRCAACNIPGTISFVIVAKPGTEDKARDLEIFDMTTAKAVRSIKGHEVGYDCLKNYGGVDAKKMKALQGGAK